MLDLLSRKDFLPYVKKSPLSSAFPSFLLWTPASEDLTAGTLQLKRGKSEKKKSKHAENSGTEIRSESQMTLYY